LGLVAHKTKGKGGVIEKRERITKKDVIAYRKKSAAFAKEDALLWDGWDSGTTTTFDASML